MNGGQYERIRMTLKSSSDYVEIYEDLLPSDYGEWSNWAFVFSGTELKLYKNAVEVSSVIMINGTISPANFFISPTKDNICHRATS